MKVTGYFHASSMTGTGLVISALLSPMTKNGISIERANGPSLSDKGEEMPKASFWDTNTTSKRTYL